MERLSRDLSIYSMGLFPLLGHSAMSVRPKLFGMFLLTGTQLDSVESQYTQSLIPFQLFKSESKIEGSASLFVFQNLTLSSSNRPCHQFVDVIITVFKCIKTDCLVAI